MLSHQMLFALAMFRDRPDELIWHVEPPFTTCLFGLIPAVRLPQSTVRTLLARGLIEEKSPHLLGISNAGRLAVHDYAKVWDHVAATAEYRARQMVHEALRRAVKGTRRKAAL